MAVTIAVIGAGASGLTAALSAAEFNRHRVILLERQSRVGKKLSVTGNGRCNITNTGALPESYFFIGSGGKTAIDAASFVRPAMQQFPAAAVRAWMMSLGLLTTEQYGGRVFPYSDSANSVVDVLRFTADAFGVELRSSAQVISVQRTQNHFTLRYRTEDGDKELSADRVIIACGGAAGEKAGGSQDGYRLLEALGHKSTKLYPALSSIQCNSAFPRALKGIRAEARCRLMAAGQCLAVSAGEVQFTETGVSGPAAFELSRQASVALDCHPKVLPAVQIDFLREVSSEQLMGMLYERATQLPALSSADILTGMVQNRIGKMLVKAAQVDGEKKLCDLEYRDIAAIARQCKSFELPVKSVSGWEQAQVTAGGIVLDEFIPETLESRIVPGLYACGEVLDVDGPCGGYNLQWAWSSGRLAGLSACE